MRGVLLQGVVPAVTSELFGLQHFATNYALTQLGPAAGTQPFSCAVAVMHGKLMLHCPQSNPSGTSWMLH